MALCPQVDCPLGGSWPTIFRVTEVTDLTAFCLWFALHVPTSTLCQCQATRIPLQPGIHPTARERKQHGGCTNSWWSWSSSPRGFWPGWPGPRGGWSPGKGMLLELWQLLPRCRAQTSVPQEQKKWGPLFWKPFIRCDLGKLTITCLSTYKMPYVTGLWSKFTSSKPGGSYSLRL